MRKNQRKLFEKLYADLVDSSGPWVTRGDPESVDKFLDANEKAREKEGQPWPDGFREWARNELITG